MQKNIIIPIEETLLEGIFSIPKKAKGIILFSHGSGSGRLSPRNQFVARILQQSSFATLLVDLLTIEEDRAYQNRFNIQLLTERLINIVKWLKTKTETKHLKIGLFGASTGAAAALKCAAQEQDNIKAVVSRGGRPDLAMPILNLVIAPTLLIVGSKDIDVITLNEQAYYALPCTKELEVISGASHLFEEEGMLEKVAISANRWFLRYINN